MKTLSSAFTFWAKVVFPSIWITGFGTGTLMLWLDLLHGKNGHAPLDHIKWIFLASWIVGTAFILWSSARLKRVRMDAENLYLSNYLRELTVPLSMISDVTENRWINSHPITIHFREKTPFGRKIVFMPTQRLFGFRSSHPVVGELKRRAGLVRR